MRAGPQTRGPAFMRGGPTRPTFLRAKCGAGQCGAGWPALPPLIHRLIISNSRGGKKRIKWYFHI